MDIEQLFLRLEEGNSEKKIIDGPRCLTFREICNHSNSFAAFLRMVGIVPGDRIAVASTDDIEIASILFSGLRFHLSVLILDPASKANEIDAILRKTGLRLILLDEELVDRWSLRAGDFANIVWPIVKRKKKLISRLLGGDSERKQPMARSYPACLDAFKDAEWVSVDLTHEPALLLCTSGTTGQPKTPRISFSNMIAAASVAVKQLGFQEESRVLDLLPLNHYDGVVSGLTTAFYGGFTLVRIGPFSVTTLSDIFDAIYKYRVTHLQLTPSILTLMMRLGDNLKDSLDTQDFQFVISVAAALPENLWRNFEEASGKRIVNVYGLTETGNYLFSGPDDVSHKIGSVGKPVDCKILIVNESAEPVAAGQIGEVLMATGSVIDGYLDESVEKFNCNGDRFFPTGDLGYLDESGICWLVGRKKNIIIVGGRNVYPDEVNQVLLTHESVAEAATIGLADDLWGERVVSCVALHRTATVQSLTEFVAERLTDYKTPREIHILPELPKGRSGKVLLKTLAEQIQQKEATCKNSSPENLEQKILILASESLRVPIDQISLSTSPQTCSRWDSVAHMDFVVNLETNFSVELLPREITQMVSIGTAVKIVSEKLSA